MCAGRESFWFCLELKFSLFFKVDLFHPTLKSKKFSSGMDQLKKSGQKKLLISDPTEINFLSFFALIVHYRFTFASQCAFTDVSRFVDITADYESEMSGREEKNIKIKAEKGFPPCLAIEPFEATSDFIGSKFNSVMRFTQKNLSLSVAFARFCSRDDLPLTSSLSSVHKKPC